MTNSALPYLLQPYLRGIKFANIHGPSNDKGLSLVWLAKPKHNRTHYRNAYLNILKTARFEIMSYSILGRTNHEARNLTTRLVVWYLLVPTCLVVQYLLSYSIIWLIFPSMQYIQEEKKSSKWISEKNMTFLK